MHSWLPIRSLHFVYQMSSLSYSHSTNKYTQINYMAQFRITNRFTSKRIFYTNIMKRSSLCKREMNIRLRARISFKDIFRNMNLNFGTNSEITYNNFLQALRYSTIYVFMKVREYSTCELYLSICFKYSLELWIQTEWATD